MSLSGPVGFINMLYAIDEPTFTCLKSETNDVCYFRLGNV